MTIYKPPFILENFEEYLKIHILTPRTKNQKKKNFIEEKMDEKNMKHKVQGEGGWYPDLSDSTTKKMCLFP